MGKTRDRFKKISDSKGTLHANMGTIKYRNSKDLTETEEIKNRWQEYTEQLYKTRLNDLKKTMMVWSCTSSQTFWSVKSSRP